MPLDPRIPLGVQAPQVQSPIEAMTQIAQLQQHRAQAEQQATVAADAARKRAQQQQIDQALEQAMETDPATGRPRINPAKLVGHLPASLIPGVMKEIDADLQTAQDFQTGLLDLEEKRRKHLGSAAQTIAAAGYDPTLWAIQIRAAQRLHVLDDAAAERLLAIEDPTQIRQVVDSYIAQAGGKVPELQKITTVDAQGREVTQFVTPTEGASYPTAPTAADVVAVQTVDAQGRPVTRFVPKTAGGEYPNQPPAPSTAREPIVSVIGPDGKPVYVRQSEAVGKTPGGTPGADPGGVKLSAGQQEDIATMLTVQDLGKSVLDLGDRIKWRGTGPIAGWVGPTGARFGMGGADAEELRNKLGNIQATIAKLRGGTSFTPNEQALLDSYTPKPTDSVLQIKAKLKSLDEFITAKRENTLRVAGGQYTPRETTTTGSAAATSPGGSTYADYLKAKGGGGR